VIATASTAPVTFISARDVEHCSILWVIGELDDFTVGAFEAECERIARASRSVIVELSSCSFISSSGLIALMRLQRRLPEAIALVTDSAHFERLLHIAGLERLFQRFDNVVDALVAVGAPDAGAGAPSANGGRTVEPSRAHSTHPRRVLRFVHDS
jgi:anti-anti-sigma factor